MQLNRDTLDTGRGQADEQADLLVKQLFETGQAEAMYALAKLPITKLDAFQPHHHALNEYLHDIPAIPGWLDTGQLEEAARFYHDYAIEIMMLLGAVSLPTCYAASPGNKVLYLSEKIRKKPGMRLLDTAAFVITISEKGAFREQGVGYKAVQQIRLIHALARFHILQSGQWDPEWGLPVNQEDMAGTNLAFSYIPLKALIDGGFRIPGNRLDAYLHLWRWVGHLMQIDNALLPDNMEEAAELDHWIRKRNFRKTEEGIALTRSLIDHYTEALPHGINRLAESQILYFVGKEVGDMIGLTSTFGKDLIVRSISAFQEFKNRYLPHRPTYQKMKKDHERLKGIYGESTEN